MFLYLKYVHVIKIEAQHKIPEAFGKKCFANMGMLLIIFRCKNNILVIL